MLSSYYLLRNLLGSQLGYVLPLSHLLDTFEYKVSSVELLLFTLHDTLMITALQVIAYLWGFLRIFAAGTGAQ